LGLIFSDDVQRNLGPPAGVESRFAYLQRSGREEAQRIRAQIECWALDFPKNAFEGWLGKFRSDDDDAHFAAFFELFLFHFIRAGGSEVLEIEPMLSNTEKRPDFLIQTRRHRKILVEAINPKSKLLRDTGKLRLTEDVKDAINELKIRDYYLAVDIRRDPDQAIPKAQLKKAIADWIAAYPERGTELRYEDRGLELVVTAHSSPPRDMDSESYRAIAIEMGKPYVGTPGDGLREAVRKKAAKYGKPDYPLIIALNASSLFDSEDDYVAALYGSPQVTFSVGPNGPIGNERMTRANNGVFNEGGRARKTHVSGVLYFNGVFPWQIEDRRSLLVHHAWTEKPLGDLTFGGDALVPREGTLKRIQGASVGEILQLL
jgi:hypothetical protein